MSEAGLYPVNKVPFQLAGHGTCLRFRTIDLCFLREIYGPKDLRDIEGLPFHTIVEQLLITLDPVCFKNCLQVGLKQEDGRTPLSAIDLDDLPFGLELALQPLLDALTCALTGRSHAALLEARAAREEQSQPNPPESAEVIGASSDEPSALAGRAA